MKFAITGLGMLNGLGSTVQENWTNLTAGKSAIQEFSWPADNPDNLPQTHRGIQINVGAPSPTPQFPEDKYNGDDRYWSRCTKTAVYVAEQAYLDSGLTSKNLGVIFATTAGTYEALGKAMNTMDDGRSKFSPKQIMNSTIDYASGQIVKTLGLTGMSTGMHAACASGLYALDYGIKTLLTDPDLDAVVVGGADTSIHSYVYFYFQNLGALSKESAEHACKPFDVDRSGIVLGEGGAALIIEPLEKAVARGAHIHALILGTGLASDGKYDISPDPNGTSQRSAVLKALRMANLDKSDIDFINAHATGTPLGDDIEFDIMRELFPNKVMVSNKGQLGHSLGASGIIETIYTVLSLQNQLAPPNVNLTTPLGQGMQLPTISTTIKAKYAVKNSFAFAGRSACAILAKYDGELE